MGKHLKEINQEESEEKMHRRMKSHEHLREDYSQTFVKNAPGSFLLNLFDEQNHFDLKVILF